MLVSPKHRGQRTGLQGDLLHVEEFIESEHEVVVIVGSANGQHMTLGSVDTALTKPPYFAELGHMAPSTLAGLTEVHKAAEQAAKAVGLDRGLSNIDIRISSDGTPYITELNARPAGNGIMNILQSILGANLFEVRVQGYLTRSPVLPKKHIPQGCAGIAFLDAPPGTIDELTPPTDLPRSIVDLKLFRKPGEISTTLMDGFRKDGAVQFFEQETSDRLRFS